MRLEFHKQVASDIARVMDYYETAAGSELANDFYEELRAFFLRAIESPESFAIWKQDLRRVNLHRFPYHFLFRVSEDAVRILVIPHHKRRPSLGIHRR